MIFDLVHTSERCRRYFSVLDSRIVSLYLLDCRRARLPTMCSGDIGIVLKFVGSIDQGVWWLVIFVAELSG